MSFKIKNPCVTSRSANSKYGRFYGKEAHTLCLIFMMGSCRMYGNPLTKWRPCVKPPGVSFVPCMRMWLDAQPIRWMSSNHTVVFINK